MRNFKDQEKKIMISHHKTKPRAALKSEQQEDSIEITTTGPFNLIFKTQETRALMTGWEIMPPTLWQREGRRFDSEFCQQIAKLTAHIRLLVGIWSANVRI